MDTRWLIGSRNTTSELNLFRFCRKSDPEKFEVRCQLRLRKVAKILKLFCRI